MDILAKTLILCDILVGKLWGTAIFIAFCDAFAVLLSFFLISIFRRVAKIWKWKNAKHIHAINNSLEESYRQKRMGKFLFGYDSWAKFSDLTSSVLWYSTLPAPPYQRWLSFGIAKNRFIFVVPLDMSMQDLLDICIGNYECDFDLDMSGNSIFHRKIAKGWYALNIGELRATAETNVIFGSVRKKVYPKNSALILFGLLLYHIRNNQWLFEGNLKIYDQSERYASIMVCPLNNRIQIAKGKWHLKMK